MGKTDRSPDHGSCYRSYPTFASQRRYARALKELLEFGVKGNFARLRVKYRTAEDEVPYAAEKEMKKVLENQLLVWSAGREARTMELGELAAHARSSLTAGILTMEITWEGAIAVFTYRAHGRSYPSLWNYEAQLGSAPWSSLGELLNG